MRKYKAWDKETELMNDVTVIDFENEEVYYKHWRYGHSEAISFKNVELLQSTGLKDYNGTEIFEGDIVSAMSEGYKAIGVVKRRIDGYWLMYPAWQNGQSWKLVVNEQGDTDVEIIGNKFEHPHLLGEE